MYIVDKLYIKVLELNQHIDKYFMKSQEFARIRVKFIIISAG